MRMRRKECGRRARTNQSQTQSYKSVSPMTPVVLSFFLLISQMTSLHFLHKSLWVRV